MVHVDVPTEGIQLLLASGRPSASSSQPTSSSSSHAAGAGAAEGTPCGQPVQHLPPIRVELTLPYGYPSTSPPQAALHAMWLPPQQAQALASSLASQYEEAGPGCPILYQWLDWLKCSALQELGVAESKCLALYDRLVARHAGHASMESCCVPASGPGRPQQEANGGAGGAESATAAEALSRVLSGEAPGVQPADQVGGGTGALRQWDL